MIVKRIEDITIGIKNPCSKIRALTIYKEREGDYYFTISVGERLLFTSPLEKELEKITSLGESYLDNLFLTSTQ